MGPAIGDVYQDSCIIFLKKSTLCFPLVSQGFVRQEPGVRHRTSRNNEKRKVLELGLADVHVQTALTREGMCPYKIFGYHEIWKKVLWDSEGRGDIELELWIS